MEINLPFPQEAAERFDALYQLLSRKYNVEQSTIKIDSGEYRIISVKDMDELLDRLIGMNPEEIEVKDERLPYWAEIWPASLAMSRIVGFFCIGDSTALQPHNIGFSVGRQTS